MLGHSTVVVVVVVVLNKAPKSGSQSLLTLLLRLQTIKIFRKQGISTSFRMLFFLIKNFTSPGVTREVLFLVHDLTNKNLTKPHLKLIVNELRY